METLKYTSCYRSRAIWCEGSGAFQVRVRGRETVAFDRSCPILISPFQNCWTITTWYCLTNVRIFVCVLLLWIQFNWTNLRNNWCFSCLLFSSSFFFWNLSNIRCLSPRRKACFPSGSKYERLKNKKKTCYKSRVDSNFCTVLLLVSFLVVFFGQNIWGMS